MRRTPGRDPAHIGPRGRRGYPKGAGARPPADPLYSSIYELAWRRAVAILIGVCVALVINRLFWPYLARKELRKRLSVTVHHLSQLFSKIQAMIVQGRCDDADLASVRALSTVVQVCARARAWGEHGRAGASWAAGKKDVCPPPPSRVRGRAYGHGTQDILAS